MKENWEIRMAADLQNRKNQGRLRTLKQTEGLLDFSSNDYLGYGKEESISQHARKILSNYPFQRGSGGSRLISGNTPIHEDFELWLQDFHQGESALLFNSGYQANLAVFSCLFSKDDLIVYDEHIHASIRDGMRLGRAQSIKFKHNNLDDLREKLNKPCSGQRFVVTESIFSMHGDLAPLQEMVEICEARNALVVVDEAHATGIFGNEGQGLCQMLGIHQKVWLRVHTFGKALGGHGAVVIGSSLCKTYLINYGRPFIYTTAGSPDQIADAWAAYWHMKSDQEGRKALARRIEDFHEIFGGGQPGPIQCISAKSPESIRSIEEALLEGRMFAKGIYPPTVPKGEERIRICLQKKISQTDLRQLADLVQAVGS